MSGVSVLRILWFRWWFHNRSVKSCSTMSGVFVLRFLEVQAPLWVLDILVILYVLDILVLLSVLDILVLLCVLDILVLLCVLDILKVLVALYLENIELLYINTL